MIRSMTGYGRGEAVLDRFSVNVEIKSVNHRFQETILRIPREFSYLEEEIKKRIQAYVKRGRVDCTISTEAKELAGEAVEVDWNLVKGYVHAAQAIKNQLNLEGTLSIADLMQLPGVIAVPRLDEGEKFEEALWDALQQALVELGEMRLREGNSIARDLKQRVAVIEKYVEQIRAMAPKVVEAYRERLWARVNEFLEGRAPIDEGRLLNEVAIYADKANVEEEIMRLSSHCQQFLLTLEQDEPVGRKLDFLIQEMNREINTIGSKANNLTISQLVVELKSEIEKMREQVQNIE